MSVKDLAQYIASRHPLIWIMSPDEQRVEAGILRAGDAIKAGPGGTGMKVLLWSCVTGFVNPANPAWAGGSTVLEPAKALKFILDDKDTAGVYVLRDFHPYVNAGNPACVPIIRAIREVGRKIKSDKNKMKSIVFLSAEVGMPPDLLSEIVQMRWPLPTAPEIESALRFIISAREKEALRAGQPVPAPVPDEEIQAATTGARGLSMLEAENCFSLSFSSRGKVDPSIITAGKKQAVSRSGALTWIDPPADGLSSVGGLEVLKRWLKVRQKAFSKEAEKFGLPPPRGMLTIGLPGTGKSLIAKAIISEWGMPGLALSADQISGGLVGESEAKMQRVMQVAEASAPCVLILN